jgi:hypothetical protein
MPVMVAQQLVGRSAGSSQGVRSCIIKSQMLHLIFSSVLAARCGGHLVALLPEDETTASSPALPPLMLPALGRKEKLMALRMSRRLLCSEARRCVGASAGASCCPGCFLLLTVLATTGLLTLPPSTARGATAGD